MNYKNKQLMSRMIFLGIFGLIVFGMFWMGQSLSKSKETASIIATGQDFIPQAEGTVVLTEFSDFQCPACRMYYPLVKELKKEFGDKLVVVYKYFPLRAIHKNADISARAGEAAKLQGKFLEMEDILFTKQDEWAGSNEALPIFTDYAVSLGLNKDKFLENIDSSQVYAKVNADYQVGVGLKVAGTPTFFLNGKRITNPNNYDEFKQLIQNSIKQ